MTKEELRKEAVNTVEWESTPMLCRPLFVHGYITGAEPREKRIAELGKENAELKEKLGDVQMQKAGEKSDLVWKLITRLDEAKEIINSLMLEVKGYKNVNGFDSCESVQKAEQFLNSEVRK